MSKVLEIKGPRVRYEFHMLNVGEVFPGFGGSRHGLQAKGTASIVVREVSAMGLRDTEYAIADQSFWRWIATLMDIGKSEGLTAFIPQDGPPSDAVPPAA